MPCFTMAWMVASNSNVSGDGTTCVTRLGCLKDALYISFASEAFIACTDGVSESL